MQQLPSKLIETKTRTFLYQGLFAGMSQLTVLLQEMPKCVVQRDTAMRCNGIAI